MLYGKFRLNEIIEKRAQFAIEEMVTILQVICQSMLEYHKKKLILTYCPPKNIFLEIEKQSISCELKVNPTQLGEQISAGTHRTTDLSDFGFIYYEAPESLLKRVNASFSLDAYWISAIAYHLFTGQQIRNGNSTRDIIDSAIKNEIPANWHSMPLWLHDVLKRALSTSPAERPSLDELTTVLLDAGSPRSNVDSSKVSLEQSRGSLLEVLRHRAVKLGAESSIKSAKLPDNAKRAVPDEL